MRIKRPKIIRRTSKCATCGACMVTELLDEQQTFDAHVGFKLNHYVMHDVGQRVPLA